jgi:hypothetical protein
MGEVVEETDSSDEEEDDKEECNFESFEFVALLKDKPVLLKVFKNLNT